MASAKLYFDFRDILRSPRIALSGKKIWIFIVGNLIGFVSYWFLTYYSFYISNYDLYSILDNYGLYPYIFNQNISKLSWLIYFLGILIWISVLFISSTAVSRVTINQLKGNHFFSISDAWRYALKYWKSVILTPIVILFIIFLFLFIGTFFAFLSSISFIGTIIFSSLFPIYFFGSIFTIYTAIVLVNSLIYTPSIVSSYEEDIMGSIFECYSISWSQPWRIILYGLILFITILIGTEIFSWFIINAYNLIFFIFKYFMEDNLVNITSLSLNIILPNSLIDFILKLRETLINLISNYHYKIPNLFDNNLYSIAKPISLFETFNSIILSTFLFIIGLSLISYSLTIFSVGQTLSFIILKKLTDGDNLLKRLNEDELKEKEDHYIFNTEEIKNNKNQKT